MMNEEIGQQKETAQETIRVDDKDYLIQMFVHLANEGIQTDITLMLGGSVITGTVIGGKQYLDELASSIPVLEGMPMMEQRKAYLRVWWI